ncbi:hypothetical protein [Streptomyces sp. NPDC005969]|uniref:hypothetical protein n=1 Tax=Streptomyces sp. NPDC005969 TaxID=3156722 RepID=UPI0033D279D9
MDWQVEVQPGADPNAALSLVRKTPGVRSAVPVSLAHSSGFTATEQGSTQTTGPGMLLGLPDGYQTLFPGEIRSLTGRPTGVLLAQQTASNLHAAPGSTVGIRLPGTTGVRQVRVDGVLDLPQADSLFQKIGAPPSHSPPRRPTTCCSCPPPSWPH